MGKSTISMAIFNSYVKLPQGKAEFLPPLLRSYISYIYLQHSASDNKRVLWQAIPGAGHFQVLA